MANEREVLERIQALESRVKKLEEAFGSGVAPATKRKKSSVREFLMTKAPKADTQKVLALGYFLEQFEGMESFNIADLEAAFRAAKEKLPGNMNDSVNKNITRGFLMEAAQRKDSKKAWCLTSTGEQFVAIDLNKA